MTDAFSDYALNHAPRPVARRIKRDIAKAEYRPQTEAEKAQFENGKLTAAYLRWKRGQEEWLLASPAGPEVRALTTFLDRCSITDASLFLDRLANSNILRAAPVEARWIALRILDKSVSRLRRRAGLSEIDDPIDPEDQTMTSAIKQELGL